MVAIIVKSIPEDIHKSLKNMAKRNHRSLNNEIIYCLEKYTKIVKINSVSLMKKARDTRSKIKHKFSDKEIQNAKSQGRK